MAEDSASSYGGLPMKSGLCRLGHTTRTCLGHIWIGDDILDATIQRFGRLVVAKRNVSLTPGPLEARKREAKRRLAHISQVNGAEFGSFDPGLIAGINGRHSDGQWHWQAPGTSIKPDSIPLISWLGGPTPHPPIPFPLARPQEKTIADPQLFEKHPSIQYRVQEHAFLSRLDRCKTIHELRDLASFFEIDVRKHSSNAFRLLYSSQRSLQSCLDFLEDTSLDDPYAQNLQYLLIKLSQQLKDQVGGNPTRLVSVLRRLLIPWVELQLSLGKRSQSDIEGLALFIRKLNHLKPFKSLGPDLAKAVLGGLRSSTVLGIRDLKLEYRSLLLGIVTDGELTSEVEDLGLSLAETVTSTALVSKFLARCIYSKTASHGLNEVRAWQQAAFPQICNLLQSRSQADRNLIIRSTSKRLVVWQSSLPRDSLLCAGLMDQWWSSVVKVSLPDFISYGVGSWEVEHSMPSNRPDILASYATHLGGRHKAEFVLSNWLAGRLSFHDLKKLSDSMKRDFEGEMHHSPFLCMLKAVHRSGFLRHDFIEHLFRLLFRMRMFEVMTEIITSAESNGFHIPPRVVMDSIRRLLTNSPKQAYQIFRCDPRIPIEAFPRLAADLIEQPDLHASIVWHYQRERPWQSTCGALELSPDSLHQRRARFLDRIALAYSKSGKLTARMARKQVTKCMTCYRKEGLGPVSPCISRALVRAGIIRPLRETGWLSYDQLTWVLGVVREVEGPEQADEIDSFLSVWRKQLLQEDNPKRHPKWLIYQRRRPLPFKSGMKWSKTLQRYERVMLPAHGNPPAKHYKASFVPCTSKER